MTSKQKLKDIKDEAFRKGEKASERKFNKIIKDLEKQNEENYKTLSQLHKQEMGLLNRKMNSKMKRLEKKETALDKAIRDWYDKIEEAENYILGAKKALSEKRAEKKEIFQKLARHIAEENVEIEDLLSEVYNSKIKSIQKNPYLLKKTS